MAANRARKKGTKVFYTAHGFHFYKGAPLKNWLLYYPVEKFCSRFTDVLITINREDYALAQRKMKAKRVEYVPGVGVDLHKFGTSTVDKAAKRAELGVPEDAFVLLSVGELNENKNHQIVIQAIAHMDVHYLIAGEGGERARLQHLIEELGISDRVKLLGYRRDVNELCRAADVYVLPSLREGLNLSVMEAMASFLPVACSRIRGNTDLIDENGGALFAPDSVQECEEAIKRVLYGELNAAGMHNAKKAENFSIQIVCEKMRELYEI